LRVVIQCAAKKDPSAGCLRARNGKEVFFVANPGLAPEDKAIIFARPDDIASDGQTWRQQLVQYNKSPMGNPLGLVPAWSLYANRAYEALAAHVGLGHLYILSAGWGLIPATFLTPAYDITFSASADRYKRRAKTDRYEDLAMLSDDSDEPVVFFGGKDYVGLFGELTQNVEAPRTVFYNSAAPPIAPSCILKRFETKTKTNWHYECAHAFIGGQVKGFL
jgi:hypothetical protein